MKEKNIPSILLLGPQFTFSDLQFPIFQKILSKEELNRPKILMKNFSEIIQCLKENPQHLAIVPLENIIQGDVLEILDEIYRQNFKILAGHWQPIHLFLCGKTEKKYFNKSKITKIFSHPQPFAQAKNFLQREFSNVEKIETSSTAEAVRLVAQENSENCLAIGQKESAEFFGLNILAENIENSKNNQTFFVLLKNEKLEKSEILKENFDNGNLTKWETAIAFTFDTDKPASLFSVLEIFAKKKINLTKIVSRPTGEKRHDYIFYLSFEGKISENNNLFFDKIKNQTKSLKVLGEYLVF